MDALKKNKFLATYVAVLVVGLLVLGWLFYSSLSDHGKKSAAYDEAKSAVDALKRKPLFPNETNLKARRTQVDTFATAVSDLQKRLLATQPALTVDAKSDAFQSKLNDTIKGLKAQAEITKLGGQGTGADFDLGFGKYLQELPKKEAVADLEFQLAALDAMVRTMLTDRVATVDQIHRAELPIESGAPDPDPKRPAAGPGGKKPVAGPAPILAEDTVLKRYPVEVRFSGSARSIQDVLNHLASNPEHFFAVRSLRVENEKKEGPPRGQVTASSDNTKKDSEIVLGGEKIAVFLSLDLLRFLEPLVASSEAKTTPKKTK